MPQIDPGTRAGAAAPGRLHRPTSLVAAVASALVGVLLRLLPEALEIVASDELTAG